MGNVLAKLPQQRIRAGEKHSTIVKLEQLFDYMDEIGIDLEFYNDKVLVIDRDRPKDSYWEVRDVVNSEFITVLPCLVDAYKITQDVDIPPRDAQPAPKKKKNKLKHDK